MKEQNKVVALALNAARSQTLSSDEQIVEGVMKWAEQKGWQIVDLRSWVWQIPSGVRVDGLIYNQDLTGKLEHLTAVPHSVRISPVKRGAATHGVGTDWTAVGVQAAEYYLNRGFRSFALAAYRISPWTDSLRAFKERVEQAGGHCTAIQGMHLPEGNLEEVRKHVRKQLRKLTYPLAIFCTNDRLAVRLCRWCLDSGIAVPEQAAILGFGNDIVACCSNAVPLSSIAPPLEQHGFEASRLLQRIMDGEPGAYDTMVSVPPQGIITRRSTDIAAIPDARAASALRYIWDHYMENIGPDEVSANCGMARRSLDRHFNKALGRTVAKEITRQRLRRACELLVGTEMNAADIATDVGFRTPQYFNFQFRQHFDSTPQRYRETERKKRK